MPGLWVLTGGPHGVPWPRATTPHCTSLAVGAAGKRAQATSPRAATGPWGGGFEGHFWPGQSPWPCHRGSECPGGGAAVQAA